MEKRYHAEIINISLRDKKKLSNYKILSIKKRFLGFIKIHTISIPQDNILNITKEFQMNLGTALHKEWYITFHTDEHVYLVFRERIFFVSTKGINPIQYKLLDTTNADEKKAWDDIIEYAKSKGVPDNQCDFLPADYMIQNYFD